MAACGAELASDNRGLKLKGSESVQLFSMQSEI
jgi:hypothetical protein